MLTGAELDTGTGVESRCAGDAVYGSTLPHIPGDHPQFSGVQSEAHSYDHDLRLLESSE